MDSVKGFFKDKSVFVTGASGFMGKVLLEKILYSCSDVKQVFILIREKKGKSGHQRVEEFLKLPLFDRIINEKPEMLSKIVPIYGEIGVKELGMSNEDLAQVTNETNIVFHMAASVKFDGPIKNALTQNVGAVKCIIEMAKIMPNLVSMVHLSTTFCNLDQKVLDETTYDWDMDPIKLLECAEVLNDENLESIKKSLLKSHPNIYTYTKRLAELLVRNEHKHLPICIVRPSVVLPSYLEPVPGWVDNLNGPVGLIVGAGKGVVRSMLCDKDAYVEYIPVDFATRGIILSAWDTAKNSKLDKVPVFNLTVEKSRRLTWGQFINGFRNIYYDIPLSGVLWYPGGNLTTNKLEFHLRVIFTQLLPALFIDGICVLVGRKRFMMQIQRKILMGCELLHHFSIQKYNFTVKKILALQDQLLPEEKEEFRIFPEEMNIAGYFVSCINGGRHFLLKDKPETLPKARRHMRFLRIIDIAVKFMWISLSLLMLKKLIF